MNQLDKYRKLALKKAVIVDLGADEGFAARIPGFKGLVAVGSSRKTALVELQSALEDWIDLALSRGVGLPRVVASESRQLVTA